LHWIFHLSDIHFLWNLNWFISVSLVFFFPLKINSVKLTVAHGYYDPKRTSLGDNFTIDEFIDIYPYLIKRCFGLFDSISLLSHELWSLITCHVESNENSSKPLGPFFFACSSTTALHWLYSIEIDPSGTHSTIRSQQLCQVKIVSS
jgi:hypothetical protein